MTRVYFIADNKTQAEVLKKCGVRSVGLNYKFVKNNLVDFTGDKFDSLMLNAGSGERKFTHDDYYKFAKDNYYYFTFILQYDQPGEIARSMSYYNIGKQTYGLDDKHIPILHEDYTTHKNLITPMYDGATFALGVGKDREQEDKLKDEVFSNRIGLGKTRWLGEVEYIDNISWLNPVRSGKLQVWIKNESREISVRDLRDVTSAYEENKEYAEKCGLKLNDLLDNVPKEMLKAQIALYFMPKLSYVGLFSYSFKN